MPTIRDADLRSLAESAGREVGDVRRWLNRRPGEQIGPSDRDRPAVAASAARPGMAAAKKTKPPGQGAAGGGDLRADFNRRNAARAKQGLQPLNWNAFSKRRGGTGATGPGPGTKPGQLAARQTTKPQQQMDPQEQIKPDSAGYTKPTGQTTKPPTGQTTKPPAGKPGKLTWKPAPGASSTGGAAPSGWHQGISPPRQQPMVAQPPPPIQPGPAPPQGPAGKPTIPGTGMQEGQTSMQYPGAPPTMQQAPVSQQLPPQQGGPLPNKPAFPKPPPGGLPGAPQPEPAPVSTQYPGAGGAMPWNLVDPVTGAPQQPLIDPRWGGNLGPQYGPSSPEQMQQILQQLHNNAAINQRPQPEQMLLQMQQAGTLPPIQPASMQYPGAPPAAQQGISLGQAGATSQQQAAQQQPPVGPLPAAGFAPQQAPVSMQYPGAPGAMQQGPATQQRPPVLPPPPGPILRAPIGGQFAPTGMVAAPSPISDPWRPVMPGPMIR